MGIQIMVDDGQFFIQDSSKTQFSALMNTGRFKYDSYIRKKRNGEIEKGKALIAPANLECATLLKDVLQRDGLRLPPDADALLKELHAIHEAVDRERVRECPKPLVKYPVKMPLYQHQTRAANMALLTFGWIKPEVRA